MGFTVIERGDRYQRKIVDFCSIFINCDFIINGDGNHLRPDVALKNNALAANDSIFQFLSRKNDRSENSYVTKDLCPSYQKYVPSMTPFRRSNFFTESQVFSGGGEKISDVSSNRAQQQT